MFDITSLPLFHNYDIQNLDQFPAEARDVYLHQTAQASLISPSFTFG
jgi:hypothetical protein